MNTARILLLVLRAPLALWHLWCAHCADQEINQRAGDSSLEDSQSCAYLRNRNYHQRRADALMGMGEVR